MAPLSTKQNQRLWLWILAFTSFPKHFSKKHEFKGIPWPLPSYRFQNFQKFYKQGRFSVFPFPTQKFWMYVVNLISGKDNGSSFAVYFFFRKWNISHSSRECVQSHSRGVLLPGMLALPLIWPLMPLSETSKRLTTDSLCNRQYCHLQYPSILIWCDGKWLWTGDYWQLI